MRASLSRVYLEVILRNGGAGRLARRQAEDEELEEIQQAAFLGEHAQVDEKHVRRRLQFGALRIGLQGAFVTPPQRGGGTEILGHT